MGQIDWRQEQKRGPLRESNPGPPAPEAGIIPLDQAAGKPGSLSSGGKGLDSSPHLHCAATTSYCIPSNAKMQGLLQQNVKKNEGRSGNRTRDLLHPKQESYL